MNFKTTLVLLVLVAAGGALLFAGLNVPSLFHAAPPAPDGGSRAALEKLKPDELTRVEIRHDGQTTVLTRERGEWSMAGKWPTRTDEVKELVALLGGLRSRFEPIPVGQDTDLKPYGLKKPPVTVKLETESAKYHFQLGEAPESDESNQFSRPTYLRLLSGPGVEKPPAEVLPLGPGLLATLTRPADYYQTRRLFPSKRVAKDDDKGAKVDRLDASAVRVWSAPPPGGNSGDPKNEAGGFELKRNDKKWELSRPERDRLDSTAEQALLTAVPDLWAEKFVIVGKDKQTGLEEQNKKITVTRNNGDKVTLLIGNVSRMATKTVMQAPPPGAPFGPRPVTVTEEYRYAKLEDNPQVFEIKAEGLKNIFVPLDTLRDAQLARFTPQEARELEIVQPGKETIQFVKEKDAWKLVKPLKADADAAKVSELLMRLSTLEARGDDIVEVGKRDPAAQGFDKPGTSVTIKWETEKTGADGNKTKTPHQTTLKFGKHDAAAKKLYVMTDDLPRVNAVEDGLAALVDRPALAYRGKRLLDFLPADVAEIAVERGKEKLTFKRDKNEWQFVAPIEGRADAAKVNQLAAALGRLQVLEFVDDDPKDDKLDEQYGVGKSAPVVVTVTFADKDKKPRTLRLGKARGDKPGVYGKMGDAPAVFAVDELIHADLERDALTYLPNDIWKMPVEEIVGVRIKKQGEDEFTLKHADKKWAISGPFDAPAFVPVATSVVARLAAPQCESYKTPDGTKDLATYGLEKDKAWLTVGVTGKDGAEHTLLIGNPVEKDGSSRFAKLADKPAVFVVGAPLVSAADRPALQLLDPGLLRLDPATIDNITTKGGDTTLTLARKGEEWEVQGSPAGPFPADKDAVGPRQFAWANLTAEKFDAYGAKVDWAKYGLDKPEVVVTIALKEGEPKEHTIELGKPADGNSGERYARVDKGQGVAVLDAETARRLARTYLDYVDRSVLKFNADDVTGLERKMGADTLELKRGDGGWQIVKPAEQRADDKSLQELVAQLADLKAVRVAAFPAKELKDYGLDQPAATLTIKLKGDAKPSEIKIGKPAEGSERFAIVGDGKAVFVLPDAVSKRLVAAPITFRDKALARFADADKLRLERGPRQVVFARVDGSWKMTEPTTAEADNDDLDELINTLAKLRADELVGEKPTADELKTYGLDKPEARWKLYAGDNEVLNLAVGGREKGAIRRYAQLGGKDIVFLLDPKLSMRALAEFRKRDVWPAPLDAFQVESVHFGYAKNPFTLRKAGRDWQVVDKPDVKPVTATVNETLAALAGLKASRYVVDKGADFKLFGLDPPVLEVEAATPTGKRTLLIGRPEGDSKRVYARVTDGGRSDVFVIDEADAAKIVRDAAAFTKAPESPPVPMMP
jgi:hypothetical protein